MKQIMLDDINSMPFYQREAGSGSLNKLKIFIEDLFNSGLKASEIQKELICYFETVDYGYKKIVASL